MNRLFGTRVYLAGPMDRVKDGGVQWRNDLTPFLNEQGVIVLDPCNKPIDVGVEDSSGREQRVILKQEEKLEEVAKDMKVIRAVDLRMVDICDFIIAHVDIDVHMCGTYEEITTANRQRKPVLYHIEQGRQNVPDWLLGVVGENSCDMIFSSWNAIKHYLKGLNSANEENVQEVYNKHRRWVFFDMQQPTKQMEIAFRRVQRPAGANNMVD